MLTCAPSFASSVRDLHPENRVEIFLGEGQNRIERTTLSPTIASSYYDSESEPASESSVAPNSLGGTVKYLDEIPVELRGFQHGGAAMRSADEALEIARAAGIRGTDKFLFRFLPDSEIDDMLRAAGHTNTKGILAHYGPMRGVPSGTYVPFKGTYMHEVTGRIPVLVKESVLTSDDAIVFVLRHEIHEIAKLRSAWRFGTNRLQPSQGILSDRIPGLVDDAHQTANFFGGQRVLLNRKPK